MATQTRKKTGFAEWADRTVSLYTGCAANCRYCWAREQSLRFHRIPNREAWATPTLRTGQLCKRWGKLKGVTAAFGTHDITPMTLKDCTEFLVNILKPGNRVLIVSKPHLVCIEHLVQRLSPWHDQIEFRFTIGARSESALSYWEPGAPSFNERWQALRAAHLAGYRTSVSIEPMLDSVDVWALVQEVRHHVTESIWIGKMNQVSRRVQVLTEEDRRRVERIEQGQTDDRIMAIVRALKDDPLVKWKDSITDVIERNKTKGAKRDE